MINEKLDRAVEALRPQVIDMLQRWIRIPSEKQPAQGEARFGLPLKTMLDTALSDAAAMGFKTRNFDYYAGDVEMGDSGEVMGVVAHLDVVPAGDGWVHDPFGAQMEGDTVYGRGTTDDKGPAIAALLAMKAVQDAGVPLSRRVRLILGCDEECGMQDMEYYRKHADMPAFGFSPDADYPVINTEKGICSIDLTADLSGEEGAEYPVYSVAAGERRNVIPGLAYAEIGCADLDALRAKLAATGYDVAAEPLENGRVRLVSTGVTGHAAFPYHAKNAAGQLLLALAAIGAGRGSRALIARLAETIGVTYDGAGLGVDVKDGISGELTMNLGVVRMTPDHFSATLDIRYPVLANAKMIARIIGMRLAEAGVTATLTGDSEPLHVPADSFIVRELLKVYHEITGKESYPVAIGGGTYSREMVNTVAFGCNFPGEKDLAHQAEEFTTISKMMLNIRIFAYAIAALAGK